MLRAIRKRKKGPTLGPVDIIRWESLELGAEEPVVSSTLSGAHRQGSRDDCAVQLTPTKPAGSVMTASPRPPVIHTVRSVASTPRLLVLGCLVAYLALALNQLESTHSLARTSHGSPQRPSDWRQRACTAQRSSPATTVSIDTTISIRRCIH